MSKVAVVTDSAACLSKQIIEDYDIRVLPLNFFFSGEGHTDDPDLNLDEFYHRLEYSERLPTTSSASPGTYLEVFKEASQHYESILCVTVASRISGMFESALVARDMAADQLPKTEIRVLDSGTAAMAQGFVALAAARVAHDGESMEAVHVASVNVKSRVELVAMVDTLKYLARSGRVPKVGAWAASLMGLKPILIFKDGQVKPLTATRDNQRGMNRMLKLLSRHTNGKGALHVSVIHANVPYKAERFEEMVRSKVDCAELFISRFTPVMGIYTGGDVLGLTYYTEG